jgi:hypothetical protein
MGRLVDQITRLVSFGDSFVFGNELSNNDDGSRAWPALAAQRLDLDYHTSAVAGVGNEHIAQQFFSYAASNLLTDCLVVINWTWIMRWDFYLTSGNTWITLGPTCVPEKIQKLAGRSQAQELVDFYRTNLMDNEIWARSRSMLAMYAVNQYLDHHGVANVQTYMDYDLFADPLAHYQAYKAESWPDVTTQQQWLSLPQDILSECQNDFRKAVLPQPLEFFQASLLPRMLTWEGWNFVDWARHQGHAISDRLHPLDSAHQEAADFWIDEYRHRCYAR